MQTMRQMQHALRQQAYATMRATQSEAFRTLARERGGVNAKNREAIEAEAKMAGRRAAEAVFLRHGYTYCIHGCGRLASPNYVECPFCEDLDLAIAEAKSPTSDESLHEPADCTCGHDGRTPTSSAADCAKHGR